MKPELTRSEVKDGQASQLQRQLEDFPVLYILV